MSTFLFGISLLLTNALYIVSSAPPRQPEHIFLLAGQSNMVGRGGIPEDNVRWDGDVPPECQPDPSIMRLDVNLNWVAAQEPIHAGIYKQQTGIGPAMSFSKAILQQNSSYGTIGLVPCALDGSSISRWGKSRNTLYANLIRRAKAAVKNGGKLEALLWWQGGADADTKPEAQKYKADLTKFFQDVRADLQLPELRIIQVVMPPGREAKAPYTNIIRDAQISLNLANVDYIDPGLLPLNRDKIHVTTPAQIIVGQLFAKKFLHMI